MQGGDCSATWHACRCTASNFQCYSTSKWQRWLVPACSIALPHHNRSNQSAALQTHPLAGCDFQQPVRSSTLHTKQLRIMTQAAATQKHRNEHPLYTLQLDGGEWCAYPEALDNLAVDRPSPLPPVCHHGGATDVHSAPACCC